MLMAVVGSKILMSAVFSATIARLLGQRRTLEYAASGAASPFPKTPSRIK
jgi:hypothetical protein